MTENHTKWQVPPVPRWLSAIAFCVVVALLALATIAGDWPRAIFWTLWLRFGWLENGVTIRLKSEETK